MNFEKYIKEIAESTLKNGGVAFKLHTCQFLPPMDVWAFPKYPSKTAILPRDTNLLKALEEFILVNGQFLREPDCWLGTWIHPQTQEFYLDITQVALTGIQRGKWRWKRVGARGERSLRSTILSGKKRFIYKSETSEVSANDKLRKSLSPAPDPSLLVWLIAEIG